MYKKDLIRATTELFKNVQSLQEDFALDIEKKFELRCLFASDT